MEGTAARYAILAMGVMTVLAATGCPSGSGGGPGDAPDDASATAPNVVFILADDVGWTDIGAYRRLLTNRAPVIPTPNLDRLAADGMMFTDAHTPDSLCAPTRFSAMTGSNPYRSRSGGTWTLKASSAFEVNQHHKTVGELMQAAGYRTAFFGKMHFGGSPRDVNGDVTHTHSEIDFSRKVDDMLTAHGFDYSFGVSSGIQDSPYVYWENDRFKPIDPDKPADNSSIIIWTRGVYSHPNGMGEITSREDGPGDVDWNSSQTGPILAQKAADFIKDHRGNFGDQPFMMYYAPQAIHKPHTPPADFEPTDPTRFVPVAGKTGATLTDMIYELDLQIGKILRTLEDEGILRDTLIIFTSDNGGLDPNNHDVVHGHDSTIGLRGYKGGIYEGGHRVPFIAHWGDGRASRSVIRPGSVTDQLIAVHDLMATMYDLTGQAMEPDQAYDSASLLPLLVSDDPDGEPPAHTFLVHYRDGPDLFRGVRMDDADGQWFYLFDTVLYGQQLYNLTEDLAETNNLLDAFYAFTDIPADHPLLSRVKAMRDWRNAHDTYAEPRTTPAVDYSDPANQTPW